MVDAITSIRAATPPTVPPTMAPTFGPELVSSLTRLALDWPYEDEIKTYV